MTILTKYNSEIKHVLNKKYHDQSIIDIISFLNKEIN